MNLCHVLVDAILGYVSHKLTRYVLSISYNTLDITSTSSRVLHQELYIYAAPSARSLPSRPFIVLDNFVALLDSAGIRRGRLVFKNWCTRGVLTLVFSIAVKNGFLRINCPLPRVSRWQSDRNSACRLPRLLITSACSTLRSCAIGPFLSSLTLLSGRSNHWNSQRTPARLDGPHRLPSFRRSPPSVLMPPPTSSAKIHSSAPTSGHPLCVASLALCFSQCSFERPTWNSNCPLS